jgi:O-methyltransferase involved in polyketide biosynthesis
MTEVEQVPPGVDATTPTPARLYDYYLGGSNNFAVDREVAERLRASLPELTDAAWANRGFHQRAARWMAAEHGIRQFIDLGSGLPTQGNTHEAVSEVDPDARVVYVDHDPMVLAHARALLTEASTTTVIQADLRDPDSVLGQPELSALIDFAQPVGLLMTAVLHFVADTSDPWRLMARYVSELAPGSYVALSHATADRLPPRAVQAMYDAYSRATENIYLRSKADFERLFDGLELVAPFDGAKAGLTFVGKWGAEDACAADTDGSRVLYCGVARRP